MSGFRNLRSILLFAGLLLAASCTTASNPLSSSTPSVTNYYTNYLENYNQCQIRFEIQHSGVVPIHILLVDTLRYEYGYDQRTATWLSFPSFRTNLYFAYSSTNRDSNSQYFWINPGSYYVAVLFPTEPISLFLPIVLGNQVGMGGYGSGVLPYQMLGGGKYVFKLRITTTSAANAYTAWTNGIMFPYDRYTTYGMNLNLLNMQYNLLRLNGY